jgi:fructose-1-phosphate kinase PfkB-like protein
VDVGRRAGARTLVDSSGEGLAGALAAGADVVLPNVGEAAAVLGREPPKPDVQAAGSLAEAAALASALCAAGARAAVVTAGAAGAAVAEAGEVVGLVPAPEVRVTNPVGAGDCLVAGVAAKLASGAGLVEATTWGVALAAASCETFTAADVDPARADELLRASAAAREGAYGP